MKEDKFGKTLVHVIFVEDGPDYLGQGIVVNIYYKYTWRESPPSGIRDSVVARYGEPDDNNRWGNRHLGASLKFTEFRVLKRTRLELDLVDSVTWRLKNQARREFVESRSHPPLPKF